MPRHDVDDLLDEEIDGLNDPLIEHLPEPPSLTGRGQSEEMYGEYAETPMGRASSPPLFAQASLFPQCQQLRIWKLENGVPSGLGVIEADASEEDLIRTRLTAMPKPGDIRSTFKMRPLDTNGREIGQEITLHISEHNPLITRMRSAGSAPAGGGGGGTYGIPSEQMHLLSRSLDLTENRARIAEQTLHAERERLLERDHQLAQERVDLAANAASSVASMSERMLEQDQSRHQQIMETERARNEATLSQQSTFMSTQVEMLRTDRETMLARLSSERSAEQARFQMEMERERERMRAADKEREDRASRDRSEYDRKLQREREEWDRRMDRERQDNSDRRQREESRIASAEAERQRQHELRVKEMETSAQRDREHAERMMTLSQQKEASKAPSLIDQAKPILGFLSDAGIDIKDVLGMLTGGGGADWTELLGTLAKEVGGVAEKALEAKAAASRGPQVAPGAQFPGMAPPGYIAVPQQQMFQPQIGPGGVPLEDYEDYENLYEEPVLRQPQRAPQQQAHVVPPLDLGQPPHSVPQAPVAPAAPEGGARLGLQAQKTARTATRSLVQTLSTTQESDWGTEIMLAIGNEMTIYHYVQDVSVRHAMHEAGASEETVEKIVAALKASPAVPADLRYE